MGGQLAKSVTVTPVTAAPTATPTTAGTTAAPTPMAPGVTSVPPAPTPDPNAAATAGSQGPQGWLCQQCTQATAPATVAHFTGDMNDPSQKFMMLVLAAVLVFLAYKYFKKGRK